MPYKRLDPIGPGISYNSLFPFFLLVNSFWYPIEIVLRVEVGVPRKKRFFLITILFDRRHAQKRQLNHGEVFKGK